MNDELTPEQKFTRDDPEVFIPSELARGRSRDEVVSELIRLDWSPSAARTIVQRIADEFQRYTVSPESRAQLIAEKKKIRVRGVLFLIVGIACALFGHFNGSTVDIYLGGVIGWFGVILIINPSRQLRRYQKFSGIPCQSSQEPNP